MAVQTGVVKVVHNSRRYAVFEWGIPNFSELDLRCAHESRRWRYGDSDWRLVISMTEEGIHYLALNRLKPNILLTPDAPVPVDFSIRCKTSDGEEVGAVRRQEYRTPMMWFDPPWPIPASVGITLTCTLGKGDSDQGVSRRTQTEDAPTKDFSVLSKDLKQLLLSETGHDVLLNVGDEQFRAHKCILQARSPVFAAMFSNQMAESADGYVTIEDCDPDAFGRFLQFLYTAEVDLSSVDSALGVYYVGDKYDIPRLKEISVAFMKTSFAATNVFDVVSLAMMHGDEELLQLAIVYFADHLGEVLRTEEWRHFHAANPIQADEMYLKVAQSLRTSHPARKRPRIAL